jgi:hypothetical protein
MISKRSSEFLAKLGLALLALGTLASIGSALTAYHGKFTLPVEAQWEDTKLPAGDYTLTVSSSGAPYTVYLQGSKASAILQAVTAEDGAASGRSQLNLQDIAGVQTIAALEVPDLGMTFIYRTRAQKQPVHETRQKGVPQFTPATEVSKNQMSIAIRTMGR